MTELEKEIETRMEFFFSKSVHEVNGKWYYTQWKSDAFKFAACEFFLRGQISALKSKEVTGLRLDEEIVESISFNDFRIKVYDAIENFDAYVTRLEKEGGA